MTALRPAAVIDAVERAARDVGLLLRGGFSLRPEERAGALANMRSVLLFGFAGSAQWAVFAASPEAGDGRPHALDRWSRRVLGGLGERFGATPLFPFDGPPYWPFQAWAQRAEPVFPSPLGLLVHADYGLSHSYRGALAFAEPIRLPDVRADASPCQSCPEKPCLTACPVGAFTSAGYDVERCAGWLRTQGGACREGGCLARRACPVGRDFAQSAEQARFHMAAFLAARRKD